MLDEDAYNSESDSDYAPSESDHEEEKPNRKRRKRVEAVEDGKEGEQKRKKEEEVGDVDSLWADFLAEAGEAPPPTTSAPSTHNSAINNSSAIPTPPKPQTELTATDRKDESTVQEEAGRSMDKAEEEKAVGKTAKPSGLGAVLSGIKTVKTSTLRKSKQDWDEYKAQNKLEEELGTFNRGKDGYLARQEFLQRTDLRQFEREKESRNKQRKNPFS